MEPGLELRIWQSGRECGAWFGAKDLAEWEGMWSLVWS